MSKSNECTHAYADSTCGRYPGRKLWNSLTGNTLYRCRTHADMLKDADPSWMDAEVANVIIERDTAVNVAKGDLRVAALNLSSATGPNYDICLDRLYAAARKLVATETTRKEILR